MDPVVLDRLLTAALQAQQRAYAPYSQFAVGAAVLTANGQMFTGANIENASYPLTICAERVALFCAYMATAEPVIALAVVTPTPTVASPCGACRQVIFELAPQAQIVLLNHDGSERRLTTPQELLPFGFGPEQLEKGRK